MAECEEAPARAERHALPGASRRAHGAIGIGGLVSPFEAKREKSKEESVEGVGEVGQVVTSDAVAADSHGAGRDSQRVEAA